MLLDVGNVRFGAKRVKEYNLQPEVRDALHLKWPQVGHYWYCDKEKYDPALPAVFPYIPPRFACHGAGSAKAQQGLPQIPGTKPTRLQQKRKYEVGNYSAAVQKWVVDATGFPNLAALETQMLVPFGLKTMLPVPVASLVAPYKKKYSVVVVSTPKFEILRLRHSNMPPYREAGLFVAIPVAVEHEVLLTHECFGSYAKPFDHWISKEVVIVRAKATGQAEIDVRHMIAEERRKKLEKRLEDFKKQIKNVEDEIERLAEESEALKDD